MVMEITSLLNIKYHKGANKDKTLEAEQCKKTHAFSLMKQKEKGRLSLIRNQRM